MKIQVGGLSDGVYQYALSEDAALLGLDEHFQNQVAANVTIEKSGSQIFLMAMISVRGKFECDRCLARFESTLSTSYRTFYITEGAPPGNIDPMELQIVPPGFSVIDMSEDVRQSVLLSVPLKLLCSEGCKGLCPTCGKNLNTGPCDCRNESVDPRWEQLIRVRKQTKS